MGLSLEFYAGDASVIGADFTAIEFDGIRDDTRARAYADFSLHLSPSDLDILSAVTGEQVGVVPRLLSDSLGRNVGGFEGEGSAEVVDPAWVRMVAAADGAAAPEMAAAWIGRIGAECGQRLVVTPGSVRAVRNLIHLCRVAVQEGVEVVHTWYL
jgi:hypothetical protein